MRIKLKVMIGIEIALLIAGLALYRFWGEQFIKGIYYGRSLPCLNSIITGQEQFPLPFYLARADIIFLKLFLILSSIILLEYLISGIIYLKEKIKFSPLWPFLKRMTLIAMVISLGVLYFIRYNCLLQRVYFYNQPPCKEIISGGLTTKQALMIGQGHSQAKHPRSSYLSYPKDKKNGVIRIGIFGCSIVAGDETAEGDDIASLLQDTFKARGFDNIEVINFGLTARGMHQAYLLWEFLGKDYNLDYVVFLPFSWHQLRDNGFTWSIFCYPPVYARYILKGSGLKLIPPAGNTTCDVYRKYYRLIPPWRYLRYERKMPIFLRALLPVALHTRPNPFYYKFNLWQFNKDESLKTYQLLFANLARQVKKVIIIANDDEIYKLKDTIHSPNIYFARSQIPLFLNSFLYVSALGHNSALGNQMRADELFSLFAGYAKPNFSIIELSRITNLSQDNHIPMPGPLYKYPYTSLKLRENTVARLVKISAPPQGGVKADYHIDFKKDKIASLLMMPGADIDPIKFAPALTAIKDIETAKFCPLPFFIPDNQPVFLSFKINNNLVKVPIGKVRSPSQVTGELFIESAERNPILHKGARWSLEIRGVKFFLEADTLIKDLSIMAQDRIILKAGPQYAESLFAFLSRIILGRISIFGEIGVYFEPVACDFIYLRAKESDFVGLGTVKDKEGTLDLVLTNNNGSQERYPLFSYKIKPAETSDFEIPYPEPISKDKNQPFVYK